MRERFYSTAPNSEPTTRAALSEVLTRMKAAVAGDCFNSQVPNWELLEHAIRAAGLPLDVVGEFMWMCEQPEGTHLYKHRDTRKYVRLTKSTCAPQLLVKEARQ